MATYYVWVRGEPRKLENVKDSISIRTLPSLPSGHSRLVFHLSRASIESR